MAVLPPAFSLMTENLRRQDPAMAYATAPFTARAFLDHASAQRNSALVGVVVSSWSPWRLPVSGVDAWSETLLGGNGFE